ncbi:MAG TPA: PRC-barrel domain-containing protein [Chloroflexota bacterium]|nr:PRC-barrel domain-containing protein [Chloroflexota bacterium]
MNVDIGARVRSMDDQDIGTVNRLIMDPYQNEVTSVVIRKGAWLPRDVEVPVGDLRQGVNGEYLLSLSAQQVKDLPEFRDTDYVEPPADFTLAPGYTPGSIYWPAGMMMGAPRNASTGSAEPDPTIGADTGVNDEIRSALSHEEWDTAVIRKGSTVTGRDGKNIGKVEDVSFDTMTGAVTALVVRSGLLMHRDRSLDPTLIESVDQGVVYLKVDSDQVPSG